MCENATLVCTKLSCPVYDPWSSWSSCSVSCGRGQRTRTRLCRDSEGGPSCSDTRQSENCDMPACPGPTRNQNQIFMVEKKWVQSWFFQIPNKFFVLFFFVFFASHIFPAGCLLSEWSSWSECSASCGGGLAVRNKTVLQEPEPSGAPCVGPLEQHIVCNTNSCLPGEHKHTHLSSSGRPRHPSVRAQAFASACRVSQWPGVQRLLRSLSLRVCRPVDAHPVSPCSLHARVHVPTWTGLDRSHHCVCWNSTV